MRAAMPPMLCVQLIACARQLPPVRIPPAPPASSASEPPTVEQLTSRVEAPLPIEQPRVSEDDLDRRSLDELNHDSPFTPVFFGYDGAELDMDARKVLDAAAQTLRNHASWVVTIEGHCDERGTAEYNLALGERRAAAVETYLIVLGVPANQLRVVSYGKEFPLDPAHTKAAWAKNRRAEFVVISK
jgi:peptidoglycan-associated lipoprotein